MTLYAVHLAWVDGHGVKAPVGIWSEGGVSFYPPETEAHRTGGAQAKTESAQMAWADWVEKRTQWGSTYGANWSAVESDQPMKVVLAALQAEFFSELHPIEKIFVPPEGAKEDSDVPKEDFEASEQREPAHRFVLAQSWWIAAELVRRHPELVLHEMHPGGGQYDVLAALVPPHDAARAQVMLNRTGTIQVHVNDARNGAPDTIMIGTWAESLGARNPHSVVNQIEDAMQIDTATRAPSSTPRTLAYRFIAAALTMTVNDRHTWDARNEFVDSSGDWWPGDREVNGFLDDFPEVRGDLPSTPEIGLCHEPESHFWAILRDQIPVAIVSIEGRVYRIGRRHDLVHEYAASGRRMLPLVTGILSDLLH